MIDNNFFNIYNYGNQLIHGKSAKIEHIVSSNDKTSIELAQYRHCTVEELKTMREKSALREDEIFGRLSQSMTEWNKQAAQTMLLDKVIEYARTPQVSHTNNQWEQTEHGYFVISNMVYKMSYWFSENTQYDREAKRSVPVAWVVSWSASTNAPESIGEYRAHNVRLGSQYSKRFDTPEARNKYIEGRKKAYAHLFSEISPPIPKEYVKPFTVNGLLLPGYTSVDEPPEKERVRLIKRPRKKQISR
ncbi:hypothetical protein LJC32_03030 [Oscillospiraceae bacterium OttesenSCG-928-F05]|nr:hypothetical protein [Oscillospiraceae bacterium OttesenSCG-928-F05]